MLEVVAVACQIDVRIAEMELRYLAFMLKNGDLVFETAADPLSIHPVVGDRILTPKRVVVTLRPPSG